MFQLPYKILMIIIFAINMGAYVKESAQNSEKHNFSNCALKPQMKVIQRGFKQLQQS